MKSFIFWLLWLSWKILKFSFYMILKYKSFLNHGILYFFYNYELNVLFQRPKKWCFLCFFILKTIFLPHFLSIRLEIDTFDVKNKSSCIYCFRILIKSKCKFDFCHFYFSSFDKNYRTWKLKMQISKQFFLYKNLNLDFIKILKR